MPHPAAMFVEGFTKEVPRYMQLADYFIGKPGPGSISEAVAMQLPVIVERNAWTLPQERYNADWVTRAGGRNRAAEFPRHRARGRGFTGARRVRAVPRRDGASATIARCSRFRTFWSGFSEATAQKGKSAARTLTVARLATCNRHLRAVGSMDMLV